MPVKTLAGATVALATMHAKDRAIGKPFARRLGMSVVVAEGIDTDALGTFTGEIARAGTMLDAARAKARLAVERTGLRYGLGSEGSFGPHPALPLIAGATEVLLFHDRQRRVDVTETLTTHRTNFDHCVCRPGDDLGRFLAAVGFPRHAVVVQPHDGDGVPAVKGVTAIAPLAQAIARAAQHAPDGAARVTTDMRAHVNPTRMAVIRALAGRLARRLATCCPLCAAPGFGRVDVVRGRPCAWCGTPTPLPVAVVELCPCCGYRAQTPLANQPAKADPGHCPSCNP